MTRVLTEKTIEITVSLNTGEPEKPVYDKVTLTGLRIKVAVLGGALSSQGQLQASIQGLTPDLMARLTTTGFIRQENRNHRILVAAGDKGETLSVVYDGTISEAYCNIQQPVSEFSIIALSALGSAITPVGASSYKGSVKVADIMADFAKEAGFSFVNRGVDRALNNPYFTGTVWDKINRCAKAGGIFYDVNKNTLTIWQEGKEEKQDVIISAEPNNVPQMLPPPRVGGSGLSIRTLFYPDFEFSKSYEVKSKDFPLANGKWIPCSIMHNLECMTPSGSWFTDIEFKRDTMQ